MQVLKHAHTSAHACTDNLLVNGTVQIQVQVCCTLQRAIGDQDLGDGAPADLGAAVPSEEFQERAHHGALGVVPVLQQLQGRHCMHPHHRDLGRGERGGAKEKKIKHTSLYIHVATTCTIHVLLGA